MYWIRIFHNNFTDKDPNPKQPVKSYLDPKWPTTYVGSGSVIRKNVECRKGRKHSLLVAQESLLVNCHKTSSPSCLASSLFLVWWGCDPIFYFSDRLLALLPVCRIQNYLQDPDPLKLFKFPVKKFSFHDFCLDEKLKPIMLDIRSSLCYSLK